MNVPPLTNDELTMRIISEYSENGCSVRSLSRKYNTYQQKIKKILIDNSITLKNSGDCRAKNLPINKQFLDIFDNELSAYFLGLAWADGYHNVERKQVCISLVRSDSSILHKLSEKILGFNNVSYTKKEGNREDCARFSIYGENISKKLNDYGLNTERNFSTNHPKLNIEKSVFHHFLRGLWDGDGSIYYVKFSKDYASQFIGSVGLCDFLKMKIKEIYNFDINSVDDLNYTHPMKRLNIHGNKKLEKFLDILYTNSTLCVERKFNKYRDLKNEIIVKSNTPNKIKGTIVVRDHNGNHFRVATNDSRYLSGELIYPKKGMIRIFKDSVNKMIPKEELQKFLNDGWIKGMRRK